ncbi:hypothetical protein ElyMa_005733200 [Elysia marginata]|uniref:Uncharacterized protein n=1 Tax=Elysia marginata TaxID=1093978 RepID=A0AAV4FMM4_9GAST|nr:hypothetical protein ElyMa_005733200 [Elysia marginata]
MKLGQSVRCVVSLDMTLDTHGETVLTFYRGRSSSDAQKKTKCSTHDAPTQAYTTRPGQAGHIGNARKLHHTQGS